MTIADIIGFVIAFVGGSSALLAAVAWLIRAGLKHSMDRDLVEFKSQMDRDLVEFKSRIETAANVEIERVRSALRISEAERGKQSTLLLERRAKLIDELYVKLFEYLAAAESFSAIIEWAGDPTKEEKAKILSAKSSALFQFFSRRRVYFNAALCEKIEHLQKTVHEPMASLNVWLGAVKAGDNTGGELNKAWEKASKTMQIDIPPLMHAIEDEFRALLGVTSPPDRRSLNELPAASGARGSAATRKDNAS